MMTLFKSAKSCFDDTFTDIAAESFEAEDMITVTEIDWETDGEDVDLPTYDGCSF